MLPLSPEPDDEGIYDDDTFEVSPFPRERLRIVEKVGEGHYGEVHLAEIVDDTVDEACKFVAVHALKLDSLKVDFEREVKSLSRLRDANVARLLGACLVTRPVCAVREYCPMGDLCQFLQDHVAESATPLVPNASTLR